MATPATATSGGDPVAVGLPLRQHPGRAFALIAAVPSLYTVAIALQPSWRLSWYSPDARIVVATSALWLAATAALALGLRGDSADASSAALVAALLALALVHGIMLVGFILIPDVPGASGPAAQVPGVYAWIVARYLTAALFVVVGLRRPELTVRQWMTSVLSVLVLVLVLCAALAPGIPKPFAQTRDGLVIVTSSPVTAAVVAGGPSLLFALAAFLAWRSFRRRDERIYFWLSLALLVQVLSTIHELVYTASFGPVVTTADVLLVTMLGLLLAVALSSARAVARDRLDALAAQERDLRTQSELLGTMTRFTEREELFRSIVTHELATPIAAIRAYAHVLANPQTGLEQGRASAQALVEEAARLTELAERMEELRSLEHEQLAVDICPLRVLPLLEETARFARALPTAHHIVVAADDVTVLADPVRLGQALRNLTANAVRYSPPATTVALEARRVAPRTVQIVVSDEGPGVPEHERERVLGHVEPRRDRSSQQGMGLGLYVVRRIVEAHGGSVRIEDREGPGARVVIELPEAT